jgi:hypothetical protein
MAYPPDAKPLPSEDLCNKEVPNPIRGKGPLEKGDSRKDLVEQLQKMLEFLEYSCGPQGADGIFGDNTRKAVLKFQSEHKDYEEKGLRQDGKVGPRTSDALNRCLVGKWFAKWPTPKEFITKDKDIREKFLLLTITQEELKKGESLDTKPEKEAEEIKKARVAIVDYVFEEVTLGIGLTPASKGWLPNATNDRSRFTAKIYIKKEGKWIYPGKKRRIIFRLNSSKEKGICMNFPKDANTNPDLFFSEDGNQDFQLDDDKTEGPPCPTMILAAGDNPAHQHHYQKMKTNDMVTEATAEVRCEDYGAFGFLEAFIDDGKELPQPSDSDPVAWDALDVSEKKVKVKIPWDKNGNDIADSADQDDNGAPAKTDADSSPTGDNTPGDGLTNFEEYRGFIVKEGTARKHLRTDIKKKDIFIHDRDGLTTGNFGVSGLDVHLIPDKSFYNDDSTDKPPVGWASTYTNTTPSPTQGPDGDTQIINFNATSHTIGKQHGLRLVNENLAGIWYGVGFGDWSKFAADQFIPKYINRIAVDKSEVNKISIANKLAQIIAHELGHGVQMPHHGEPNPNTCNDASHTDGLTYDPQGGFTSGDTACIMRYDNYAAGWCHTHAGGSGSSVHTPHPIPHKPQQETPGNTFCVSTAANGCNVVGNCKNVATKGRCKNRIRVKD